METIPQQDKGKTVGILAYCTLIGFIIALVLNNDQNNKSELGIFHIRQALGIFATGTLASMVLVFIPIIGWLALMGIQIALLIFWILGLIAAINSERKAIPILGDFYQNLFKGIN